jgi:hypothetical protein
VHATLSKFDVPAREVLGFIESLKASIVEK